MAQTAVVENSSWQGWEGRVVGGRFTLLECLEYSEESAYYLTEVNGATALLKLLRADTPNADAQVAGWELAGKLSHPNLVRIFEVGKWHADEELDMHFAVMEYCEESLSEVLRLRPLTSQEVGAMLTPLLDALQYLHERGIVHGHLSPANIRAHADQLKLTTDELRFCGAAAPLSTPALHGLPEKASGTGSFSSDIRSLGMTLCQALTKRVPPLGNDGRPLLAGEIPAPFDAIVKRCLAVEGGGRTSLNAIRDLLNARVNDRPDLVLHQNPAPMDVRLSRPAASIALPRNPVVEGPAEPWTSRRSTFIAAGALLLLIAILIGVRVAQKPADAPGSAAVSASKGGSAAPSQTSGRADHASSPARKSGTVVHEVLPEIEGKVRGTIHGTVRVKVQVAVDARGSVTSASLAAKSPSVYFERQALQAARHWSFTAPVRDGRPQPSEWIIRFEFLRGGTRATAQQYSPA